jgi:hypothetical protein
MGSGVKTAIGRLVGCTKVIEIKPNMSALRTDAVAR